MRFLLATPAAAAFALSCSALLAGCGGGAASHVTPAVATHQQSGSARHVKGCNPDVSPDGCDTVGQYDIPEYIDSFGAPCDPSAPFDINNPCQLNPDYQFQLQQPVPRDLPSPQCIDIYPGGVMNKKSWHQCFSGHMYYN